MNKNILISVSLLIIILLAGWLYARNRVADDGLLASERAGTMQIVEVSMEGTVLGVESDHLVVSTVRIERTEKGNELVEFERIVRFEEVVQVMSKRQTIEVSGAEALANLKLGDKAVFYGSGEKNTLTSEEFLTSRIEVIARAEF